MRNLRTSLLVLGIFSLLLGIIYPLAITGIAGLVWPHQVNGSVVRVNGKAVGSLLIGQQFSSPLYFHGRPSECGYDAARSAGLNLGPSNPQLLAQVRARIDSIRTENGLPGDAPVPADLVLASGSGLDPDISPASALLQVGRVARTRNLEPALVRSLVLRTTDQPFLGIFGQPRVNVLKLNLALDSLSGPMNEERRTNNDER
ncbi:MAG: potassium-transporting ATPase subunit KdpC [candidate division WOR-3 bacterium]|nr:potassium-transporting ATPase subunit KdpC [candidate division WOR-3 bacterium]